MNLKCILPLAASLLLLAFPGKAQQSCYDVVPLPQKIELQDNQEPFLLSENTEIAWKAGASDADGMKRNAAFLAGYIEKCLGFAPETVGAADGDILLVCDPSCKLPKEGYRAEVTADGIVITGSSPAGVFYGIQMLRKALPVCGGRFPAAEMEDYPHFGYRGAHFDVCRHFFGMDEVKTYIDMMVLHNMNTLHWHITDDQGWRVEIKRYPELISKGSMRDETLVGHLNDRPEKYDGKPYGGYFISFDSMPGCAKNIAMKAKKAGVKLTPAGATFPYGKDPEDKNLRIAPTYPSLEEIREAAKLFSICVKLATIEKLLGEDTGK